MIQRRPFWLATSILVMGLLGAPFAPVAYAAPPFVVNSNADPGTGGCTVAECTLREAITAANAQLGADDITFALPSGQLQITPTSGLPNITEQVVIDGTTQPAFVGEPLVVLNGASSGVVPGLHITGGGSTVKGLVIQDFGSEGIRMTGAGGNVVEGNYIGTDVTGTSQVSNGDAGVHITGTSSGNRIGGSTAAQRNVISENDKEGVRISGTATSANVVIGNYIGVRATGNGDLGNSTHGVFITDSAGNQIGGTATGEGNVISGSDQHGIYIISPGGNGLASGNYILGNKVGTNAAGSAVVNNTSTGVRLESGPQNNFVGDGTAGGMNLISGNNFRGVEVYGNTSTGNRILGNYVGTNLAGTASLGNSLGGIAANAPNTVVGAPGQGNLISGNQGAGLDLSGSSATGVTVQGNLIGTTASGAVALPNTSVGISLDSAASNLIGGSDPGEGNVISGNTQHGIRLGGTATTGNVIQGNLIGTASDGTTEIGQGLNGIQIGTNAGSNDIGGISSGEGNRIAFNQGDGVRIQFGTGNTIRGNSMESNGGNGIDLDNDTSQFSGVTPNDAGDGDAGGNGLLNFPDLTEAVTRSGGTTLIGTYMGGTGTFTIDVYSNPACDGMGYGEGGTHVTTFDVTTVSGTAQFSEPIAPLPAGEILTATATDVLGNTSEFSECTTVRNVYADLQIGQSRAPANPIAGGTLTYTLNVTNTGPDLDGADDVVVADELPATLVPGSANPSQGACSRVGQVFTCNLGDLPFNGSASVTVTAASTMPVTVVNTASVTSATDDPDLSDNTSTNQVLVGCTKRGTARNDTLRGTSGKDVICGGAGNDTITGLGGNDLLFGGGGSDTLKGDAGIDKLYGEAGADKLFGLAGNDVLNGGTDNDKLTGGLGNDSLRGDTGTDVASFNDSKRAVTANLTTNRATGNGTDTMQLIEALTGSRFKDTLSGNGLVNKLTGGKGADKLYGLGGKDSLYARDRVRDVVNGGKGRDKAQRDKGLDAVTAVERYI